MTWINNKSILTRASGFLAQGYTHSLNPYSGCTFANTLCGQYCYMQHNFRVTNGREWEFYGAKKNTIDAYIEQYNRLKFPNAISSPIKPLKIYMSSATDPYVPQEQSLKVTRTLLQTMLNYPPDTLVIQTRNPLVLRDIDLIQALSQKSKVWLSMTIETDKEQIKGLQQNSFSPKARMLTAQTFKQQGIPTQITVSPLMPLNDIDQFAKDLGKSCDRIILDHYLLGDGSKNGLRTKRTNIPKILEENGYHKWLELDTFYAVCERMMVLLGADRVLLSTEGFNAI